MPDERECVASREAYKNTPRPPQKQEGRMRIRSAWMHAGCAALSMAIAVGSTSGATAAELPPYMDIVVADPNPGDTAGQNVLALNTAMFGLYGGSAKVF